jgi:hypothetical protein
MGKPGELRERLNPAGSTKQDRADVLAVLGVLKVATATQIMRLVRPHLTDNKTIRNALLDQQHRGWVDSEGNTAGTPDRFGMPGRPGGGASKLWSLTRAGLDAAGRELERDEMGSNARGAAAGGARHAMAVNEAVIAFTRGGTPPGAPGGLGSIRHWTTEVAHPLTASGKTSVRADAVLTADDDGVPVLLLEVDRGTETAAQVAEKVTRYAAYFRRPAVDPATWS